MNGTKIRFEDTKKHVISAEQTYVDIIRYYHKQMVIDNYRRNKIGRIGTSQIHIFMSHEAKIHEVRVSSDSD